MYDDEVLVVTIVRISGRVHCSMHTSTYCSVPIELVLCVYGAVSESQVHAGSRRSRTFLHRYYVSCKDRSLVRQAGGRQARQEVRQAEGWGEGGSPHPASSEVIGGQPFPFCCLE
jgi:hypothetical protein